MAKVGKPSVDNTPGDDFEETEDFNPSFADNDIEEENLEDVLGFAYATEEVEKAKHQLQIPKGDYFKADGSSWNMKVSYSERDAQPGDRSSRGRMLITLHGRISDGRDIERVFAFTMSPDLRYFYDREKEEHDENRYDGLHLLWWQAREYFEQRNEVEPKTPREVIDFLLQDEDIIFRITEGKNGGNFLGGFKKPGRR